MKRKDFLKRLAFIPLLPSLLAKLDNERSNFSGKDEYYDLLDNTSGGFEGVVTNFELIDLPPGAEWVTEDFGPPWGIVSFQRMPLSDNPKLTK